MNWDVFLNQLRDWLATRQLLRPEISWVVGVSGGPDSTLLAHAMKGLSERDGLQWRLHIAHFHHGLRGDEADADAQFVSDLADELGSPYLTERTDIRSVQKQRGGSMEEVARNMRYEFLERVALKTGSELVAVAHHADDNAETVIHRICRGTGLRGLAGIRDVRPIQSQSHIRVVRPFLAQRRDALEQLCVARGIEIRVDSTNQSDEFTRGRIRHRVMPVLANTLNPHVSDALLRLAEHAQMLGTYLSDAAARTFESLVIAERPQRIVLNTRALGAKQRIIQAEVVRRAVSLVLGREQDLNFAHVESILKLAREGESGKEVHVPGPVAVRKQYDRLEFQPLVGQEPLPDLGTTFITCPGRTALPTLGYTLIAEVCPVDASLIGSLRNGNNRLEEWLDYDRLHMPLLVRGRQDGDRFHPLGAPGAKTIGDFFTEQKIEPAQRARTGILCDQEGPLWVMPLRIADRAKLRNETSRALRLVLSPLKTDATFEP